MYQILFMLSALLMLAYCLLILMYRRWFLELEVFVGPEEIIPETHFSIIIPARNEAANIRDCVLSILTQAYPLSLFEVIVINDYSTDDTANIVQSLQKDHPNLHLINLSDHLTDDVLNAYKKKAIETAIASAKGNWIITTDADCVAKPYWLSEYDAFIQQQQPVFVAAPVMFVNNGSFLSIFQLLDFISLQGITAAAVSAGTHAMCNGANLAYQKKTFYEVGQFKGIDTIASGDDMLLMQKIKQQHPGKLGYLFSKKAIIETQPMPNWKSFLNQRIRWASKADSYKDKSIFAVLLLVYLLNLLLLILFIAAFFVGGIWKKLCWLLFIKTVTEMSFMYPVSRFFNQTKAMIWFPLMQPFHILYTVIAGWLGKFGSYQWKGRKLN